LKREICQQLMAINCFLIVVLHEQLLQWILFSNFR
jgi:hypothetical protein